MGAPLNVVLVEPEIPQNAGNVARTCACTGARLHLVEPMGFRLTQRQLARAGCDYWDEVDVLRWPCAAAFFEAHGEDELHLFTGRAARLHSDATYGEGAFLVFGRESRRALRAHPHARGTAQPQPLERRRHSRLRGPAPARLAGPRVGLRDRDALPDDAVVANALSPEKFGFPPENVCFGRQCVLPAST